MTIDEKSKTENYVARPEPERRINNLIIAPLIRFSARARNGNHAQRFVFRSSRTSQAYFFSNFKFRGTVPVVVRVGRTRAQGRRRPGEGSDDSTESRSGAHWHAFGPRVLSILVHVCAQACPCGGRRRRRADRHGGLCLGLAESARAGLGAAA